MTKFILINFLIISATICFIRADEIKCPEGSSPRTHAQLCEPSCKDPVVKLCNPADKNNTTVGCRCISDPQYYRNDEGKCVTLDKCPKSCSS